MRSDGRRCPYWIVKPTVVECETVWLVPVIVKLYVPEVTFRFVLMFSVELPVPVRVDAAKLALARLGMPLTLKDTEPVKVPALPTVTVYVVLDPREIIRLVGVAESVKLAVTTNVTFTVWVSVPLVAVIVS